MISVISVISVISRYEPFRKSASSDIASGRVDVDV